jgi:hypothetical protein
VFSVTSQICWTYPNSGAFRELAVADRAGVCAYSETVGDPLLRETHPDLLTDALAARDQLQ